MTESTHWLEREKCNTHVHTMPTPCEHPVPTQTLYEEYMSGTWAHASPVEAGGLLLRCAYNVVG